MLQLDEGSFILLYEKDRNPAEVSFLYFHLSLYVLSMYINKFYVKRYKSFVHSLKIHKK